jgi:hypothetical protein
MQGEFVDVEIAQAMSNTLRGVVASGLRQPNLCWLSDGSRVGARREEEA